MRGVFNVPRHEPVDCLMAANDTLRSRRSHANDTKQSSFHFVDGFPRILALLQASRHIRRNLGNVGLPRLVQIVGLFGNAHWSSRWIRQLSPPVLP